MAVDVHKSIFSKVADFFVSEPTLQAIAEYKVPSGIQQHIDDLLDKHHEGALSSDERLELEKILALTHMMDLAKIKAKLKLASKA